MAIYADDVLVGIFHFTSGGSRQFTADRERLHRVFHDLRKQDASALRPVTFRNKGIFPESQSLDQALANLEAAGLLRRQNDAPLFYFIQDDLDKAYKKHVRSRLQKAGIKREQLKKISQVFASKTVGA